MGSSNISLVTSAGCFRVFFILFLIICPPFSAIPTPLNTTALVNTSSKVGIFCSKAAPNPVKAVNRVANLVKKFLGIFVTSNIFVDAPVPINNADSSNPLPIALLPDTIPKIFASFCKSSGKDCNNQLSQNCEKFCTFPLSN